MIIPTFNVESDIQRPINSLFNQTIGFENIELIFIDDCSTDNTQNIILDYATKYDNIKYLFLEKNSGSAGKPRNIGIKYATADYIMFLDNDDEYVPEACEILYKKIKETDANLIICSKTNDLYSINESPIKTSESPTFQEINILENPNYLYSPYTKYGGAMWCKIFKREFILKNNIQCLEKLPEDVYFMHQCYYQNPKILFLTNLSLYNHYFYRVAGTSITVSSSYNFLKKSFLMFDKLKELSLKYKNTEKFFNRYVQLYFNVLIYHIIISNSTKNEKISLMKCFYNRVKEFNFMPDNKINKIWYSLIKIQKFKLCFIYTNIISRAIQLKSMPLQKKEKLILHLQLDI